MSGRSTTGSGTGVLAGTVLGAAIFAALGVEDGAAKPRPDEDGGLICIRNNYEKVGGTFIDADAHKCCYWEYAHAGEAIHVCLQCDENWKNCEETLESRVNRPDASTGTSTETAPPGRTLPGTTTTTPGIELRLETQP